MSIQCGWIVVLPVGASKWNLQGRPAAAWSLAGEPCSDVKEASLILVNAEGVRSPKQCEALGSWLQPAVSGHHVWIHFGSQNTDRTDRLKITSDWQEFCAGKGLDQELRGLAVNPFSMGTQNPLRWDRELQLLAEVVRTNGVANGFHDPQSWFARLTNAWRAAVAYYDAAKPLGAWSDALFRLYLGIQAARARANGERQEQLKAAKQRWFEDTQRLRLPDLSAFLKETAARATSATLKTRICEAQRLVGFLHGLHKSEEFPSVEEAEALLSLPALSCLLQQEFLA